jgi:hypothetical protein
MTASSRFIVFSTHHYVYVSRSGDTSSPGRYAQTVPRLQSIRKHTAASAKMQAISALAAFD